MLYNTREILQYVRENDVKFIRLAFCDMYGTMKNLAVLAEELPAVFEGGMHFDAAHTGGFGGKIPTDMVLMPDPDTMEVLPWRPQQGRVARFYCNIRHSDGTPFAWDGRYILRQTQKKALKAGYTFRMGVSSQFFVFRQNEQGEITRVPQDRAGYLDVAPLDGGENLRRDICLTLERMEVPPLASHHSRGPGQNEVVMQYAAPLTSADNVITYRGIVRTLSAQSGYFATFMPLPLENEAGNSMYISVSVHRGETNLFSREGDALPPEAGAFVAGVLRRLPEMAAFMNPLPDSYRRLAADTALRHIAWGFGSRDQMIRIPDFTGDQARMQLRSADSMCNPYLVFALLLEAGLEGAAEGLTLPAPAVGDEVPAGAACLPESLEEALSLARDSDFIRRVLPEEMVAAYCDPLRPARLADLPWGWKGI